MSATEIKGRFKRHPDDEFFDALSVRGSDGVILRIWTRPRLKTSDMSGDEWRTSAEIEILANADEWATLGHAHGLDGATRGLFYTLHTQSAKIRRLPVIGFDWQRKGVVFASQEYNDPVPLLTVAGLLAWEFTIMREGCMEPDGWDDKLWCFQPGCASEAVSTYKLRDQYCSTCGWRSEIYRSSIYRRFCPAHLYRGNCGLEDSDWNYEVVEGPGPDEAQTEPGDVSPAASGGLIFIDEPGM